MNQQTLLTVPVPVAEVARKSSLGKAIEYCAELAELTYDKALEDALREAGMPVDKTQLSRWQSGGEGIKWDKFCGLMDVCGNDAPLLWMLHQRGYDLSSLRKQETELEKENRQLRDELATVKREREVELRFARELRIAA